MTRDDRPRTLAQRLAAEWPRLEPLLDQWLELAEGEARTEWLARLDASDPALAALVRALAASSPAAADDVAAAAPALVDDAFALGEPAEEPAERWGPFRRVRELGRGGTGHVFLARRDDGQFEQDVAVKVLRLDADSAVTRERLLRERQMLARLDHPGLSRLIDGGIGDDGRPWFAMEHVEGEPITAYVRAHSLPLPARLALFRRLLAAVRYLHQNLLVHRDLKPANVLVTSAGDVRVLDLGIARILDDDSHAPSDRTEPAMTPAYAAPEQILGLPATTSVDVFALGLVLHEMVADRPAFPDGRLAPGGGDRAAFREPVPTAVDADLDAIVARALRTDPRERYPSVDALDDDLARWLAGEPVAARRGGWRDRAAKSLRRHRVAWAALAALVLVVAVGFAATAWQARVARAQAARAEAVSRFLLHVFEAADPDVGSGPNTPARTLLDRGAARIEAELRDQPVLRAEMQRTLGGLYSRLGDYDQAWALLSESWRVRAASPGLSLEDRVASVSALAEVSQAMGRLAEAESLLHTCTIALGANAARLPAEVATVHYQRASVCRDAGRVREADSLAHLALVARRRPGADPLDLALSLNQVATIAYGQSRYGDAVRDYTESLAIFERVLGAESLRAAALRSHLAIALMGAGRLDEAEPPLLRALEVQRRQLGPDHPRVASTLSGLGGLASLRRQLPRAESLYTEQLRIVRLTYGARHPEVAKVLHDLGRTQGRLGRFGPGEAALNECLGILGSMLGPAHPYVGKTLQSLGELQLAAGRTGEAEATFRRSLAVLEASVGPAHEMTALSRVGLGRVLLARGRRGEARALADSALAALGALLPADDPRVREARKLAEDAER